MYNSNMLKKIRYKKTKASSLKGFSDKLWSLIVRTEAGHKCIICGKEENLNAHHLVSRKVLKYRFDTKNSACLCPNCHTFSPELSAHTAPWHFEENIKENYPDKYAIHVEQRNNIESVKLDYYEVYLKLEQEYKKLTGEYHKISRLHQYIMFKNAENINDLYVNGESISEIADKYDISKNAMKKFMTTNEINLEDAEITHRKAPYRQNNL